MLARRKKSPVGSIRFSLTASDAADSSEFVGCITRRQLRHRRRPIWGPKGTSVQIGSAMGGRTALASFSAIAPASVASAWSGRLGLVLVLLQAASVRAPACMCSQCGQNTNGFSSGVCGPATSDCSASLTPAGYDGSGACYTDCSADCDCDSRTCTLPPSPPPPSPPPAWARTAGSS